MMQKSIRDWMLDTIREENNMGIMSGWLEEERFNWTPLVSRALQFILSGGSFILLTDTQREWFGKYITTSINKNTNRPFFPIFELNSLAHTISKGGEMDIQNIQLFKDMLSISHCEYSFWYIGKNDNYKFQIATNQENSFLWLLDHSMQNGFTLSSTNQMLDFRLIQLFRIFDKALNASLAGRINLEIV